MVKLHPMLVHFPIALLFVAVLFEAIGRWRRSEHLQQAGFYTLVTGLAGAVLALVSGKGAELALATELGRRPGSLQLVNTHQTAAFATMALLVPLAIWRLLGRRTIRGAAAAGYWLVAVAGVGGLLYTGYLGGEVSSAARALAAPATQEVCSDSTQTAVQAAAAAIRVESVWARPSAAMAPAGMPAAAGQHGAPAAMGQGAMTPAAMGQGANSPGAMQGPTSAVYMVLVNRGDQPDALVAARSDVAQAAELHQTTIKNDVMRMQPVPRIEVPAGGQVELKRGGLHIMLLGVKQPLAAGDRFRVVLVFARAGEVPLEVEVREP